MKNQLNVNEQIINEEVINEEVINVNKSSEETVREILTELINEFSTELVKKTLKEILNENSNESPVRGMLTNKSINVNETSKLPNGKVKVKINFPLDQYPKKDLLGKPIKLSSNVDLILTKLSDVSSTGNPIVSLRRENSNRIFYTFIENLTSQGIVI
jgi:hypothetical protein